MVNTVVATVSANMTTVRIRFASMNAGNRGYALGGSTGAVVATGNRVTYATDTNQAVAGTNLSQARQGVTGITEGAAKGYACGGLTGTATLTRSEVVNYIAETSTNTASAALPAARWCTGGLSECFTKAYIAGGSSTSAASGVVDTAYKIPYATDTMAAQSSANLSQARWRPGCISEGTTKGYICGGGTNGASVTTGEKLTYSTDTTTVASSANLSSVREGMAGCPGPVYGYFGGGSTANTAAAVSTMDRIAYATDTTAAYSPTLSSARSECGALSENSC